MATATQDDFLIIQDEAEASGEDFSFNFDFDDSLKKEGSTTVIEENNWDTWSKDEIINLETTTVDENNTLEVINDESLDIDIGEIQNDSPVKLSADTSNLDKKWNEDNWLDFSTLSGEAPNESTILSQDTIADKSNTGITIKQTESEDLNSILSGTIAKLNTRKKAIAEDTDAKRKKAAELKVQVESLESEVSIIEAEITSLWLESEKIDTNISQLESMRLDPVKEHNSRRSVKK